MMPPGLRWTAPAPCRRALPRGRRARVAAWLAALLLLAAAGCSTSSGQTASTPTTRPSTPAKIAIVAPTSGAVVQGPTLHVVLTLSGATLVPPGTTTGVTPTQGHIHLLLDGSVISMTSGLEQDIAVTPGSHLLEAEFVANDHFPFNPRDLVSVHFTAQ